MDIDKDCIANLPLCARQDVCHRWIFQCIEHHKLCRLCGLREQYERQYNSEGNPETRNLTMCLVRMEQCREFATSLFDLFRRDTRHSCRWGSTTSIKLRDVQRSKPILIHELQSFLKFLSGFSRKPTNHLDHTN